ncbi:DUF6957 family protein [Pseudomonas turukhanskensis]|uniref:DUF6957 domain-containing protein n=1 Tax=Pseudomonas turukhanskensis TaxID=1806536 RepID=A0A9W6K845_9PSED|nr:hypothetical protein [Pseudomonas turukhanskensis]GLK89988.1 hypothetical protein GCM10017655_30500 [Pseudomonas turukhanskensis]
MKSLKEITELLYASGVPMPGSSMSDEDALSYARKNFPCGNFCLVRDWLWLDIETTDAQRHALEKTQRQPALIYAHQVVFDSERRWDVGDFVRSSLLHQFSKGFHFKTLNSVYLLLGPGSRKRANAGTIACLI